MKPAAIIGSFASFLMFGLLQSLFGPALGWLARKYHVPLDAADTGASLNYLGALAGIAAFASARSRLGDRMGIGISLSLLGGGALIMSVATSWAVFLLASLLAGCGAGGIDYGLSIVFVSSFGRRRVVMLNALHGMFGFGSVLGPALMGLFSPTAYRLVLLGVSATVCIAMMGMYSLPQRPPPTAKPQRVRHVQARQGHERARSVGFILFFVLQVGVEFGIGIWEPQHLRSIGENPSAASFMTAAFWLALAVGRIAVGAAGSRARSSHLAVACSVGATLGLCATWVPTLAVLGYCIAGLFLGPLFPTGLGWIAETAPAGDALSAWCIGLSWMGGIVFPVMIGVAVADWGPEFLPLALVCLMAACAGTSVGLGVLEHRKRLVPI